MQAAQITRWQHGSRRGGSVGNGFSVSTEYNGDPELRTVAQVQQASSDMVM